MRKLMMYSMYDKKSNRYDTPFFCFDDVGAKRHFIMTARNEKTTVHNFKDEFELWKIGEFDVENGTFYYEDQSILVLEGKQIQLEQ